MFKIILTTIIFVLVSTALLWGKDRGYELFQKSDYEKARSYYESILQKHSENAEANYGLGTSAYKLQDYQAAMEAFEKALSTTDPALKAKIYYNMGNTLYQAQRLEESLAFYRKALELAPDDQDAKINYELLRYQMKPQQQQQQSQGSQDKQRKDQEKKEEPQNSSNQSQNTPQDQQSSSQEKQGQKDQSQTASADSLQQKQQSPQDEQASNQQQNLQQAKAILDALKENEKIHQKIQMARAKTRTLEKDW
ncbi:MAG: tetratricopeptide repeat protein [Fidelibacterota bacterium]